MSWWSRLWSSAPAPSPANVGKGSAAQPERLAPATPSASPGAATPASCDAQQAADSYFLPWLPAHSPLDDRALSPAEQSVLNALHDLLKLPAIPDTLLPRAAELVPQLIALLRETDLPLQAIAQRISKDAMLTAEVLRLASSSYYRAQKEVTDLVQAIQLIGSVGLQTAIARVVLKPIYRDNAGLINPGVVTRLTEHAEALAEVTAQVAESAGHPRFDGYLIGMLHDTGWRVALRAIERAGLTLGATPSRQFANDLSELTHRLFGLAARRWAITPGFTALANDAFGNGLAGGQHALAPIVQHALQQCLSDTTTVDPTQPATPLVQ